MDWNKIKDYMNSFVGIILLTLPFFFIPEIKKSKLYIAFFIIATLFLLWLGTDKMQRDEKAKTKDAKHSDSVINANKKHYDSTRLADKKDYKDEVDTALKKYGLRTSNSSKIVTIIDTSARKPIDPVMDIPKDSISFIGDLNKTKLSIRFGIINNSIAYNPRCKLVVFQFKNRTDFKIVKLDEADNELLKSWQNQGYKYQIALTVPKNISKLDTSYIYFKVIYSNKITSGTDQPPLRKLYLCYSDFTPKTVKDIKIEEISDMSDYDKVKKSLIKSKHW